MESVNIGYDTYEILRRIVAYQTEQATANRQTDYRIDVSKHDIHELGILGEYAFSRRFNLHMPLKAAYDHGWDFTIGNNTIDVKATTWAKGKLVTLAKPYTVRASIYVLTTIHFIDPEREDPDVWNDVAVKVIFRGWTWGNDLFRDRNHRRHFDMEGSYSMPQDELESMHSLKPTLFRNDYLD